MVGWQSLRHVGGIAVLLAVSTPVSAQLMSIEDAVTMSKRTGRPIFALAGSKT